MKFTLFPILLALGALQVNLVLGTVESRRKELTELWYEADSIAKGLKEFEKQEIDSRSEKIFNETIYSLEHVTNLTLQTQKEIEDEADALVAEDESIDIDSCLDSALSALKNIIVSDCGDFGKCRDVSVEEIQTIVVELTEYIKIIEETKIEIIYIRDKRCIYYSGYAKELCLYCKIPQIEVTIVSYTKKVERFKKRTIKYIEQIVQEVTVCIDGSNNNAVDKIHQIAEEIAKCFEQLCNPPTTTLPSTTVSQTTVQPTTPTSPAPTKSV